MKILLTNDDGYNADGIQFLFKYFTEKGHSVKMVAPDGQRSGFSQKITIVEPVSEKRIDENILALSGTPADCVLYTLRGLIADFKPDLVIAGVNDGANVGLDIIYSGTDAAARQGAMLGVPSIALSFKWRDDGTPMNETMIRLFLDRYFDRMYELAQDTSSFVNVNFPISSTDTPEVCSTFVSRKMAYQDEIISFDAPNCKRYSWIRDASDQAILHASLEVGSDAYELLVQHHISVSVVDVYPGSKEFKI